MVHRSFGIIVYRKKGEDLEFLLVKNKKYDFWGFPKGTPEEEETEIETAKREFEEETGLKAPSELSKETFVEDYIYESLEGEKIHKINKYFLGELLIEEKAGEIFADVEEVKWVPESEVPSTLTFEEGREIYRNVIKTF